MKKVAYILLLMFVALSSCKQNDYLDWKALNQAWLEYNKMDSAVVTTQSGLQYKKLTNPSPNPTESKPNYNSTVDVDYKLYLISSYGGYRVGNLIDEQSGAVLNLQQVVSGFSEGLQKMRVHDDFMLFIPYDLGYGTDGSGVEGNYKYIPPYSTLIYEIHLNAMM